METSKSSYLMSSWSSKLLGAKFSYKLRYYHQRKRWPNLRHPEDISEILISSLFSNECLQYVPYVDKVLVRDYIAKKGFASILLKHYGVWENPEDIDFTILPEKFILKSNNGCGHHVICKDKSKLDINQTVEILKNNLLAGKESKEPHYRSIKPLVFCEELIDTGSDEWPTDYKFTCINGDICDIFVATDRSVSTHYCTLNKDWEYLPYTKQEYLPQNKPQKPEKLDQMIEIAKTIAKDFKFVRVDLYEHQGKVFFSELTFYPWGALMYSYTDEAIKMYGDKYNGKNNQ